MSDRNTLLEFTGENPDADALVDALLTQMAASQSGDDEAFLERVEAAISSEPQGTAVAKPRFHPAVRLSLAAAAVLTLGLGLWFLTSSVNQEEPALAKEVPATAPGAVKETESPAVAEPAPLMNEMTINYVVRLQENVKKADEAALRGSQLMADGDYQGAIDQYRATLDLLPEAPMTDPRRRAYVKQFSRASVLLAARRAEEGRYPESIALLEEVLRPKVDPDNIDALRQLERLNDPDYYSPALTPSHLERARRLKLAIRTGGGYVELGDFDRAEREFNKALNDDPYNTAARRGMEENERHRMNYYDAAYDHTRSKMLREVAAGWESPVPSQTAGTGLVIPATVPESTTARYAPLSNGSWASPAKDPLSTFSIDVDTASWTNLRSMIRSGVSRDSIPKDSIRIEELINYFSWDYPQPQGEHPFAFALESGPCPWNAGHRLVRVGIQGREIPRTERPAANLVFLVDVSGSMNRPEKLPLVKRSLTVLVEELDENDHVTLVVYAGSEGIVLSPTSGRDQTKILQAIDRLESGGSTNGGAGIKRAYALASEQFVDQGINRVILCTDGDFNVGVTGTGELVDLVEAGAKEDVYLSVLGFGQDNLNDAMLEEITNRGNGNYFHIDDFREARKVFLGDLMGTLVTIAKDVKIQVEFNPAEVSAYRLIGYANRRLEDEDFANDEVDAGEVGAGHAVTALYEIVPQGAPTDPLAPEELRYQKTKAKAKPERERISSEELAFVKLRYKRPDRDDSVLMSEPVKPQIADPSDDLRFAAAVALFGMILRDQDGIGDATLQKVIELATPAKGDDPDGYRAEFIDVVRQLPASE